MVSSAIYSSALILCEKAIILAGEVDGGPFRGASKVYLNISTEGVRIAGNFVR
jgi:hypothetical protein